MSCGATPGDRTTRAWRWPGCPTGRSRCVTRRTPTARRLSIRGRRSRPSSAARRTGTSTRSSHDETLSPTPADQPLSQTDRRLLWWEIVSVFAVSLGASGVYAFVSYIGSLTARQALSSQQVILNGSHAPGRPLLDLFLQLVSLASGVAPVILVFYLLARNGEGPSSIGVDLTQPRRDFLRGAGLAALIGGCGLGLYLIAYKSGVALNVVAENLPDVWWRIPVLLLSALQNGLLEEVLVTGYL